MSCFCDYDPADVWEERKQKARKQYRCYECREMINVGDSYIYVSSLFEGRWWHHRLCEYCDHDGQVLKEAGLCYTIGDLKQAWTEYWRG